MSADRHDPKSEWPREDPLLDAALEEVLGSAAPPDLSVRILQAWELRRERETPLPAPAQRAAWNAAPPSKNGAPGDRAPSRSATRRQWTGIAVAACLVLAVTIAAGVALRGNRASTDGHPPGIVHSATQNQPEPSDDTPRPEKASSDGAPRQIVQQPAPLPASNAVAQQPAGYGFEKSPPFAASEGSGGNSAPPESPGYARAKPKPDYDLDVVAFIDRALRESWQTASVAPSPPATDGEWARRTYVRILGRIPTYEELTAFLENPASNKREVLVSELLYGDDYVEQYARHWSDIWTNLLIGRSGATDPEGLANREGLEQYLRRSFQFNKPYDQMAFELVSATGANRPGGEGYNGAVNFLLANYTHNFTLATSKTARVFLGKQLHCAQCHNHPFESWTQDDFWGLNAFFHQATVVRDVDQVRLANRDFPGESGDLSKAEIYYDRLNGLRKVAYPKYLDGTEINPHGQVAQVDRRRELANFLSESRDLSRAMVNRLWQHFLGYGFVEPVDDMRPGNPPTHPELLAYLSDQFVAHDYDVKRLLRWISLSEAFSLSSRMTPQNLADAPEQGVASLFSHYYTRQVGAEEMYDSLAMLAAAGDRSSQTFAQFQQDRRGWLGQFTMNLETDEGDEANTFNGTIPQSLAIMNSEAVQKTIDSNQGVLHQIIRSGAKPAEKLERLFLTTVARKPTKREIEAANRLLADRQGDLDAALADLWWALLNSNEFILDH